MSKRPRRKFETGFKKQLVAQIETGQITATEAAQNSQSQPHCHLLLEKTVSSVGELSEGPTRREKNLYERKWSNTRSFWLKPIEKLIF